MTDPIARLNAALEGRYAIERELGEGGMATVYLADDLKHERKVAGQRHAGSHQADMSPDHGPRGSSGRAVQHGPELVFGKN